MIQKLKWVLGGSLALAISAGFVWNYAQMAGDAGSPHVNVFQAGTNNQSQGAAVKNGAPAQNSDTVVLDDWKYSAYTKNKF